MERGSKIGQKVSRIIWMAPLCSTIDNPKMVASNSDIKLESKANERWGGVGMGWIFEGCEVRVHLS